MGNPLSRVEKEVILKTLMDKQFPLKIHGNKIRKLAYLQDIENRLLLKAEEGEWEGFSVQEKIRVFFSYYDHVMTFEAIIEKLQHTFLYTRVPENIYKNLKRKAERVPSPEGVSISFAIKGKNIVLNYPKTEEYNDLNENDLNPSFDTAKIDKLIGNFTQKIENRVSSNKITMFRHRGPESYEESLIVKTGKILFIPSTIKRFPERDDYLGSRIITHKTVLRLEDPFEINEREVTKKIDKFLSEKYKQGIIAEIYCPLVFHEYVVGYVYVSNTVNASTTVKPLDKELLKYIYDFSKVFVYALHINGYFKIKEPLPQNFDARIIDLSTSGILFAHSNKELNQSLNLYTDLNLKLTMGDKTLHIPTRIIRKFLSERATYYGVQFMDIKQADFRYLFDFVYGRPLTTVDMEKWEGGAKPPELRL